MARSNKPRAKAKSTASKSDGNAPAASKEAALKKAVSKVAVPKEAATSVVVDDISCIHRIGEVAGMIWHQLNDGGPTTLTKLATMTKVSKDDLLQGVGWLAREGKLAISDKGRTRTIALR